MSFDPWLSPLKAAAWERAKGELRAVVAIHGAVQSGTPPGEPFPYEELQRRVEAFITEVEDEGLHE
jgi:hypothetical protein